MRSFLAGVAMFLGLQALLAGAVAWLWTTHAPPAGYHTGSRVKHQRLREAPSPRVVFVGGSSVSFGIDSALAEQVLGRNAVNMGSMAWLGLEYMLDEAEAGLRPGDAVVLAPELSVFDSPTSRQALVRVLRENTRAFRLPTWEVQKWFLDHGHGELGAEVRHLLQGLLQPEDEVGRSGGEFDVRGDFAGYDASRPPLVRRTPYVLPDLDGARFGQRIALIHAFAGRLEARGIRVWFAYPPLVAETVAEQKDALIRLERVLAARLRLPRLLTLDEAALPQALFYDSDYHLGPEGRRRRTELLAERLRRALSAPQGP
jgi:hypothetical protein